MFCHIGGVCHIGGYGGGLSHRRVWYDGHYSSGC